MAYKKKPFELNFPVLGVDRRVLAKGSPPGTSVNAMNVRSDDSSEGRIRGGSRPGLLKAFAELLGAGSKVQMLGQLNIVGPVTVMYTDTFTAATLGSDWSFIDVGASNGQVLVTDDVSGVATVDKDATSNLGEGTATLKEFEDFDVSKKYTITLDSVGGTKLGYFQIVLRMDETTPHSDDSILCFFLPTGSAGDDVEIQSIVGGSNTGVFDNGGVPPTIGQDAFTWSVEIDADNIKLIIDGTTLFDGALPDSYVGVQPGSRIAIELFDENQVLGVASDMGYTKFTFEYQTFDNSVLKRILMAVSNGSLYVEESGVMTLDTGPAHLNPDLQLQGIDHLSKYYIADYGDVKAEETGSTISTSGLVVKVLGVDLTGLSIDIAEHVIELYDVGESTTIAGMYTIASVALNSSDTDVTLDVVCNDGATAGSASIRIGRGPKVYNPAAAAGQRLNHFVSTTISTKGSPPFGNASVARYNDRLSFAVDQFSPHLWWQSRQGDPTDFDYFPAANDVQRAVAGQSSEAGAIGDQIIAQIVHSDDYMIYASPSSMYVLRGDAAYGGRIDNISRSVGITGRDSYCFGPEGELIFLTPDGIYTNARGVAAPIQSVSREKIPRELLQVNTGTHHISMVYDVMERGIHFIVSGIVSGTESFHFFVSWPFKGFMPVDFADGHDPFALWDYTGVTVSARGTLLGCRDGFIRQHSFTTSLDDTGNVKSMAALGPEYLGNDQTREGILKTLSVGLDEASADVKATIIVGENHAQAMDRANAYFENVLGSAGGNNASTGDNPNIPWVAAYARTTYTLTAGVNNLRPNVRGTSIIIVLENADNTTYWALEDIQGTSIDAGRRR